MKAILKRQEYYPVQTLGTLTIYEGNLQLFECKTLELEEENNQVRDDCIPKGTYTVIKRNSKKFGNHFHILDVPDRSYILIHSGNFYTQILGCVIVGSEHKDINHDGLKDVVNSKVTMIKLLNLLPDKFQLTIE